MKEEDGSITFMWVTVTTPLDIVQMQNSKNIAGQVHFGENTVLSAYFDV